jgi:hypothetical protein
MNEQQWLSGTDPQVMLDWLREQGSLSERKARLFAVACCHRIWPLLTDERSRRAVEVAARYADGLASREELAAAEAEAEAPAFAEAAARARGGVESPVPHVTQAAVAAAGERADATIWAAWATSEATRAPEAERRHQAALLRDLFGPLPFRPVPFDPAWRTRTAVAIGQVIYAERDFGLLPVLADALEDAGCESADLLDHCRRPGEHARGCWVVDLVLSRE